jgi:hypothetical protein
MESRETKRRPTFADRGLAKSHSPLPTFQTPSFRERFLTIHRSHPIS